jgi:hypothetical protein
MSASGLLIRMMEESLSTPEKLRQRAERCTRLAAGLTDARTIGALRRYAHELLVEANWMEASTDRTAASAS